MLDEQQQHAPLNKTGVAQLNRVLALIAQIFSLCGDIVQHFKVMEEKKKQKKIISFCFNVYFQSPLSSSNPVLFFSRFFFQLNDVCAHFLAATALRSFGLADGGTNAMRVGSALVVLEHCAMAV